MKLHHNDQKEKVTFIFFYSKTETNEMAIRPMDLNKSAIKISGFSQMFTAKTRLLQVERDKQYIYQGVNLFLCSFHESVE